MKKEPEIRIVKRLKVDHAQHVAISALGGLQKSLGDAVLWLGRLVQKFSMTEKVILAGLITVIVVGSLQVVFTDVKTTELKPASGGVYIEGVVGQPKFINPLLAGTNAADQDLCRLIYSGLTKIGPGREILPDLATSWDVLDSGKTYVFHLQPNAKWHDGESFSADDVVYTFNILQNNDYSGILKSNFAGVLVEKIDDLTVKISLPTASIFFLTNVTVGILPMHVFQNIAVSDLASKYNSSQIIGTGPYKYQSSNLDEAITLSQFKDYYGTHPYLEGVVFYFFDNTENLAAAFRNRQVGAAGFLEKTFGSLAASDTRYEFLLPQYKAIFFNQLGNNPIIKNQVVRQALAYAVNKQNIIDVVEQGYAARADAPILPGFPGHNPNVKKYDFDIAKAANLLKKDGWTDSNADGILDKDKGQQKLNLTITFRDDAKSRQIAELVQQTWRSIGAEVALRGMDAATLIKDVIRPRNYDVLIFGQDLGGNSDPYVYWHSSQIKDPGLDLAPMVDKDIDNNLEQARTSSSLNGAINSYLKFQAVFADLVPAVLLYQPKYTYLVDAKVKGVTDKINLSSATDRFINIGQWYVKSKRE
jgi:peptide/nickel transport system substrate-binding protein